MTKATTLAVVTAVLILAVGVGARIFAQDVRGPELKVHTTLYTSPIRGGGDIRCQVLNASDHDLQVDMHLVFTDGFFFDDTTFSSTQTLSPKRAASIGGGDIQGTETGHLYCRFSFTGNANQVRAMLVNGALSSEAR